MTRQRHRVIKGQPISSGIVLGTARVILPGQKKVVERAVAPEEIPLEIDHLREAVDATIAELTKMRDAASRKMGGQVAKIFDALLLIAADEGFLKRVIEQIKERQMNAGYIYNELVQESTLPLRRSPDQYMRQMAVDIDAVANRILAGLGGYEKRDEMQFTENTVLVGKSFTPAEVLQFRQQKVTGFVVSETGQNSHAALIARSLMLPVVVAEQVWTKIDTGNEIIVDGTHGRVIIYPNQQELSEYEEQRQKQGPALITRIKKLAEFPPVTADGRTIGVAANLELPGPVENILAERKVPIGLYRTEFLYLDGDEFPDEEAQYTYYDRIAKKFPDTYVVLRTFDLGSDKSKTNGITVAEANPALGWRGIRSMLDMPDIFKAQIRAMLRASVDGKFKILLPMISDISEIEKAKRLIAQVMLELRRAKIPYDERIPVGVMIEVPSAALTADQIARKVDFMSIGTNDLTQYTMAVDRNNMKVSSLYNTFHPSVLHLINMTVQACHKQGIPVTICGEVAGDPLALPLFIGLGVDQLSMNPARIVNLCRLIKRIDSSLVERLVESVLASASLGSVTRKLQSYNTAIEKK